MNEKLSELLMSFQKGNPIIYNHYFTKTIQKVEEKCRKAEMAYRLRRFLGRNEDAAVENVKVKNAKMPDQLSALTSLTKADMDHYTYFEILDCMEAFYKVSHSYLQLYSSSK